MIRNEAQTYQKLVENIHAQLINASRVNQEAERKQAQLLKELENQAKAARQQQTKLVEQAKQNYRSVADKLISSNYESVGVRIPPMIRPVLNNLDPQSLCTRQNELVRQISRFLDLYLTRKKAEDDAAARARAAAQAALEARRRLMSQPKSEPAKKQLSWKLIVSVVVIACIFIACCVMAYVFF